MPFTLIKGTYHVRNYSPDGDSIRFMPTNPALMSSLSGPVPKINARGYVQLRIEAVDTLETYCSPPSGGEPLNQPLAVTHAVRTALLGFVKITNVVWSPNGSTVVSANDGTPGYILARSVKKYGRPIAFVFAGTAPEADGASVVLDAQRMQQSFNYQAVARSLAYATYYKGLFFDLRNALTTAVVLAWKQRLGVYRDDATTTGVVVSSLAVITTDRPILPKLFRRTSEYMVNFGSIVGFKQLMAKAKEPVYNLRQQNFTHFDMFIEQKSERIKLTRRPEELIFDEMPTSPAPVLSLLLMSDSVLLPSRRRKFSDGRSDACAGALSQPMRVFGGPY